VLRGPDLDETTEGSWALLRWVDGETRVQWTSAEVRSVRRLLGQITAAFDGADRSVLPTRRYDAEHIRRCRAVLLEGAARVIDDADTVQLIREAGERAASVVSDLMGSEQSAIRADPRAGNVVWQDSSPGLIDFGRCGTGPATLEIAMAQHYPPERQWTVRLEGYLSIASSADVRVDALPALWLAAALDSLATLATFIEERDGLRAELPWLAARAAEVLSAPSYSWSSCLRS
jgi:Ser/Thr protein kinase RdoA (MazF antagonist)